MSYLLETKVVVHTNHDALHCLIAKKDVKLRLIRWVLLFQELEFQVEDLKRV